MKPVLAVSALIMVSLQLAGCGGNGVSCPDVELDVRYGPSAYGPSAYVTATNASAELKVIEVAAYDSDGKIEVSHNIRVPAKGEYMALLEPVKDGDEVSIVKCM